MNNINIEKVFVNQFGSKKWFEVHFKYDEQTISINLDLEEMKKLGVTKSLNGTKKLREWLMSDKGYDYIKRSMK
ncbi:hypothetical protein PBN151_1332 [Paenibacillus sp. NAIST15-1]|nr:hypothetical protein PBN151_1332 [Paenibacillus sp. NAIST15-1]